MNQGHHDAGKRTAEQIQMDISYQPSDLDDVNYNVMARASLITHNRRTAQNAHLPIRWILVVYVLRGGVEHPLTFQLTSISTKRRSS